MQHQKTLDKSIANPTLIFLYCLSDNVRYLQPVHKKYPPRFSRTANTWIMQPWQASLYSSVRQHRLAGRQPTSLVLGYECSLYLG